MSYSCRLLSDDPKADRRPGDCWYVPAMIGDDFSFWEAHYLSLEYLRDWYGRRPPITIVLPDGTPWCIDHRFGTHNGKKGPQPGWAVTGTEPLLTATPSIHAVGRYHGWLRYGTLSDDLDGRTY